MMSDVKVVGFVCRLCALISSDLGPPADVNVKIETVELPCAGKVDGRLLLEAFEKVLTPYLSLAVLNMSA